MTNHPDRPPMDGNMTDDIGMLSCPVHFEHGDDKNDSAPALLLQFEVHLSAELIDQEGSFKAIQDYLRAKYPAKEGYDVWFDVREGNTDHEVVFGAEFSGGYYVGDESAEQWTDRTVSNTSFWDVYNDFVIFFNGERGLEELLRQKYPEIADYSDLIESVANSYNDRAMAILGRIADLLTHEGLTIRGEPYQMFDDEYQWWLTVRRESDPDLRDENAGTVDVMLELAEQRAHEGGEGYGISFGINIVEWGGSILGGLMPYNYTDDVWVDARDDAAVEERFSIIEDAHIDQIPSLILED